MDHNAFLVPDSQPLFDGGLDLPTLAAVSSLVRNLPRGKAAGPSGWTYEMIKTLCADEQGLDLFHKFIHCGLTGALPSAHLLCAAKLIPLPKSELGPDSQTSLAGKLRPIAMGEVFYRVLGKFALASLEHFVVPFLSPTQYGLFLSGGAELVIHQVRAQLAANPTWGLLQMDLTNAFNTISRRLVWDTVRVLFPGAWSFVNWAYGSSTPLWYRHHGTDDLFHLPSAEGVRQGCALGSLLFALAQQVIVAQLPSSTMLRDGHHLFALHDDNILVGPPAMLRGVFDEYVATFSPFGLAVNPAKCRLYLQPGVDAFPAPFPVQTDGIQIMSVPIGGPQYVLNQFTRIIADNLAICDKLVALPSSQLALLMLRSCVSTRIRYWLRCLAPTPELSVALETWDAAIFRTFLQLLRLPVGYVFPSPVAGSQIAWPIKYGGMGLPSALNLWPIIFVAGMANLLSHLRDSSRDLLLQSYPDFVVGTRIWESSFRNLFLADPDPALANLFSLPGSYLPKFERRLHETCVEIRYPEWIAALPPDARVRIQSLAAKGASAWLHAIPSHAGLTLDDDDFQLAVLIRLGCPPPAPLLCQCDDYHGPAPDLTHPLGCPFHGRSYRITRHNIQLPILQRFLQRAGWLSRMEPRRVFSDARISPPDARRPDIEAYLGTQGYAFDLAITYPLAHAYRRVDGSSSAIAKLEQKKMAKYEALSAAVNLRFVPVVLDVFGGLGESFSSLLQLVSRSMSSKISARLFSEFYRDFSLSLQRSNARSLASALRVDRSKRFALLR
jgi:hypothetical protein